MRRDGEVLLEEEGESRVWIGEVIVWPFHRVGAGMNGLGPVRGIRQTKQRKGRRHGARELSHVLPIIPI